MLEARMRNLATWLMTGKCAESQKLLRSAGQILNQEEVAMRSICRILLFLIAVSPGLTTQGAEPWQKIKPYFTPPEEWQGRLGNYRSPLVFNDGSKVKTPADWKRRRAEILAEWEGLLGKWPTLLTKPEVEILESNRRENFMQHKVRFLWTPNEKTTGYLLIPDGDKPRPGVVTVFYEPETAIGLGKPNRDFALQLARRGFVALSIGTTEASQAQTYALYYPSIKDAKVEPLSMLGCAAANAWHVLANRPEVDSKRIGIVGHSFGGKWGMFASCLFDKFACAAWSDPGIVFDTRPSINYWEPWYLGYHPKPWRKRGVPSNENPARGLYPKLLKAGRDLHEPARLDGSQAVPGLRRVRGRCPTVGAAESFDRGEPDSRLRKPSGDDESTGPLAQRRIERGHLLVL